MQTDKISLTTIFLSFLRLGCVAFGGPVAHLGYFQEEFVNRRKWMKEEEYADLVALCQFLPGPASSQVGFAIGHRQGGIVGAFMAWIGFTLPSAVLMIGFALGLMTIGDIAHAGWVTGLKLAAVAVVANAIWNMAKSLCPDRQRALITLASAMFLLLVSGALWQIVVIGAGAVIGWILFRHTIEEREIQPSPTGSNKGWLFLAAFVLLLLCLPALRAFFPNESLAVMDAFYRAGSLVFGGGHVVLPLLDAYTVQLGWVSQDTFLAGYGAAQALPGPLFAFSAFLGSSLSMGPGGIGGGILALLAIYVPSWLLVLGAMPYWERLRHVGFTRAALKGTNAAVVGLLIAAFYDPVWSTAVTDGTRLAFALGAFALLRFSPVPPWLVVLLSAGTGLLLF
jgi:chromate transporter